MTQLADLARQVGANERTLRRAVEAGTYRANRSSPRKLEVSLTEKAYIRNTWKDMAALRSALRTESNVRFALLFGSMARGDHGRDSDLDLLVVMADESLDRRLDLSFKLGAILNRQVDLLTVESAGSNPVLLNQAVADGRVLVDRDHHLAKIVKETDALSRSARRDEAKRTRAALEGIDRLLAGRR